MFINMCISSVDDGTFLPKHRFVPVTKTWREAIENQMCFRLPSDAITEGDILT